MVMKKSTPGPVTSLTKSLATKPINASREIIYGTQNGCVGQLLSRPNKLKSGWKISTKNKSTAAVNCLALYDVTEDGVEEVLIGREDGRVEVYGQSEEGMNLLYQHTESDSVRGIKGGVVDSILPKQQISFACFQLGHCK